MAVELLVVVEEQLGQTNLHRSLQLWVILP